MERLEIIKEKLKSFAQLPQPEYAAISRIVMEDLKLVEAAWSDWREKYEIDMGGKFMQAIYDIAESGNSRTYSIGDMNYEVSVTRIKTKK